MKKLILIIMDGWGIADDPASSAIDAADTPFYDHAVKAYPFSKLNASGLAVGLPEGQMGNSEVGHTNIGAGRVVYQDLVRINQEISSGNIKQNPRFQQLLDYCRTQGRPLHLMGLLSDGGVHSSIHHLTGLLNILSGENLPAVYVHAFMDGRDTDPHGGLEYVRQLEAAMKQYQTGKIASLIGRYYAMDRDKRWPRIKKAYELLVHGKGREFETAEAAVQHSYQEGITDEFMEPAVIVENGKPVACLQQGDAVLFFNFRTDRGRQLTTVLTQQDMPEEGMHTLQLYYTTMTRYDDSFKGVHVLYEKEAIVNGLGEFLSRHGATQLRIAETEKYPHVTFFFNGGREEPMEGERYVMCPSPKVPTYDLQPEMSASEIEQKVIEIIRADHPDFICLNFANPDMVGHTGVFEAAVKACETVDACTHAVAEAAKEEGYICLITADHGNADRMRNPDGSPNTAHTTALVPLILIDPEQHYLLKDQVGKLGDLAPTILELMGLAPPEEMTGDILVVPVEAGVTG
ncbi:MAG: 2,3-bisphosphoglycerate-independent phosphoglycerate mutase [Bacteroidetes bacterium]|nr:MAG: 2,3-bisphosphoglycerate-independent phosphoglycerate mutase [Bacteroidota bacterium]